MASAIRSQERPGPNVGTEMQNAARIVTLSLLGAAAAVSSLLAISTRKDGDADIGVGITLFALFAAAFAVGGILGFLFGLPRGRFSDDLATPTDGVGSGKATLASAHYLASSNLNKVSDWLTTIVIGLGLVNLGNALPALRSLAAALQAPLGGAPYAGALGIASMITGLVGGFLVVYLYTTIRVRQLLEESERQSDDVPELEHKTLGEAERVMRSKRLHLDVAKDADRRLRVTKQNPRPGETVPAGSPVSVELASPDADSASASLPPPRNVPAPEVTAPTENGTGTPNP